MFVRGEVANSGRDFFSTARKLPLFSALKCPLIDSLILGEKALVMRGKKSQGYHESWRKKTLDYLPPDSTVYRIWLREQPGRSDWDRWIVMGIIGVCVGMIGFFLHQLIDLIADTKWNYAQELIQENLVRDIWPQ